MLQVLQSLSSFSAERSILVLLLCVSALGGKVAETQTGSVAPPKKGAAKEVQRPQTYADAVKAPGKPEDERRGGVKADPTAPSGKRLKKTESKPNGVPEEKGNSSEAGDASGPSKKRAAVDAGLTATATKKKKDPSNLKGPSSSKVAIVQYVVCWAILCFGLLEVIAKTGPLTPLPEAKSLSKQKKHARSSFKNLLEALDIGTNLDIVNAMLSLSRQMTKLDPTFEVGSRNLSEAERETIKVAFEEVSAESGDSETLPYYRGRDSLFKRKTTGDDGAYLNAEQAVAAKTAKAARSDSSGQSSHMEVMAAVD